VEVKDRARSSSRPRLGSLFLVLTLATLAVAVVGAGIGSAKPTRSLACGGVPNIAPNDPDGLLAKLKLPKSVQHDYTGWTQQIRASQWANWKPKGKAPYKVAVVWSAPSNSWNAYVLQLIPKFLKRSPLVDKNIIITTASSQTAVSEQVQQYNAAVQQGADIILTNALSATALQPAIEAAAKQGIPTVSEINTVDSPAAVSISPNTYLDAAYAADQMVKALNGKGNVLQVLGVPGTSTVIDEQKAWMTIFNGCPGINVIGEVPAFYSVALAKTGVLQFLSTHSQSVDGVIETAVMTPGILQAFQQAGRPVPFITDISAQKGFLAYWKANQGKGYKASASLGGATSAADLTVKTMLRMLAGQGPKVSQLIWRHPTLGSAGVQKFVPSAWTPDTVGTVENPKATWWTDRDLDHFFNHPNLKKGTRY
jgi:ribose transport system substrate-binding protein